MKIAWIGTGVMGSSMALNLMNAGHQIYCFNRTASKTEPLKHYGAVVCDSAIAAAANAEVVFTMLGFPADVEEVYLDETSGILTVTGPRLFIDMTTSQPSLAKSIYERAESRGVSCLDAPVSGGDVGARNGTLAIMVGGDKTAYNEAYPLFEILGENISLLGSAGAGQHCKMVNQILIASTMVGVCEALLYAAKQGLDETAVIDIIGKGAAGSWSINNLGPRIVKGDFEPGFYVEHFIKDMKIAIEEAQRLDMDLPGLRLAYRLYQAVAAQGHNRSGTQALIFALKDLSAN